MHSNIKKSISNEHSCIPRLKCDCVKLHYGLLVLKAVQLYSRCLFFYSYFNISGILRDDYAVQHSLVDMFL